MPILAAMTELEAVNEMLMSIGQAPVNTLEISGINDVAIARRRLTTALRTVQSRGWWFNTDYGYELAPDTDGHIRVPTDALKVESGNSDITERSIEDKGRALYDRASRSFEFDDPVACEIVWFFPFEAVPQTARDYVSTIAARRFQSKAIGSQILDRFEEEDELKARVAMIREDRASRKTNLFRDNPRIAGFGSRSY